MFWTLLFFKSLKVLCCTSVANCRYMFLHQGTCKSDHILLASPIKGPELVSEVATDARDRYFYRL